MDPAQLSIDDWAGLLAELGDLDALPAAQDPRGAELVEDLYALAERIGRGEKPDPEQTICDLALLRRAYMLTRGRRRCTG